MATTRQWLNLFYGLNRDVSELRVMTSGMFRNCLSSSNAKTLYMLLPEFCIAYSQRVPIFEEVLSSSG